jgi:hypothetical protein
MTYLYEIELRRCYEIEMQWTIQSKMPYDMIYGILEKYNEELELLDKGYRLTILELKATEMFTIKELMNLIKNIED